MPDHVEREVAGVPQRGSSSATSVPTGRITPGAKSASSYGVGRERVDGIDGLHERERRRRAEVVAALALGQRAAVGRGGGERHGVDVLAGGDRVRDRAGRRVEPRSPGSSLPSPSASPSTYSGTKSSRARRRAVVVDEAHRERGVAAVRDEVRPHDRRADRQDLPRRHVCVLQHRRAARVGGVGGLLDVDVEHPAEHARGVVVAVGLALRDDADARDVRVQPGRRGARGAVDPRLGACRGRRCRCCRR